ESSAYSLGHRPMRNLFAMRMRSGVHHYHRLFRAILYVVVADAALTVSTGRSLCPRALRCQNWLLQSRQSRDLEPFKDRLDSADRVLRCLLWGHVLLRDVGFRLAPDLLG